MIDGKKYTVLGIHGKDVATVSGNVARVRMFVGEKVVDEDFDLPELMNGVPDTSLVYEQLLQPKILARVAELEQENV